MSARSAEFIGEIDGGENAGDPSLHGDLLRSRRAEKERRDIDAVKFLGEPEPGKNGANFALGKPAKTR